MFFVFNLGEEPNGQPDQTLIGEEVGTKLVYGSNVSSGSALRRDESPSSSVINHGGYSALDHPTHVTSVIQRSGPPSTPSSSAYAVNGSRNLAAAFYSYQQARSRSPSPARGGSHCNGGVAPAANGGQRATAASPLHSHSVSNGSSAASSQRSYQSSPKMMLDAEPYSQHVHAGYLNSVASSSNLHHSSSSSNSSSTHPSYSRVDDLASRSHRLEEALLRASRKSPPVPAPANALPVATAAAVAVAASSSSSSSSSSAATAHFNAGNSGRTSADELLELKKRSG